MSDNSQHKIMVAGDGADASNRQVAPSTELAKKPSAKKRAPAIRKFEQVVCPKCGTGHILKGRTAYGCSRFKEGCDMTLPFSEYPADLTPSKLNQRIKSKSKTK